MFSETSKTNGHPYKANQCILLPVSFICDKSFIPKTIKEQLCREFQRLVGKTFYPKENSWSSIYLI